VNDDGAQRIVRLGLANAPTEFVLLSQRDEGPGPSLKQRRLRRVRRGMPPHRGFEGRAREGDQRSAVGHVRCRHAPGSPNAALT